MKVYKDTTVWDEAMKRISHVFDNYDNICISFSGGKDSGVMLSIVLDYMRDNNIERKIDLLYIDLEVMYSKTTEYIERMIDSNLDIINPYWVCLPLWEYNSSSHLQPEWVPWENGKEHVRPIPDKPYVISSNNNPFPFYDKLYENHGGQEAFAEAFHKWLSGGEKLASFIGIRTDESLRRYSVIANNKNNPKHISVHGNVHNIYPIYDWKVSDIWTVNAVKGYDYNEIYDLFYKAGIPPHNMRVCEPFGLQQRVGLHMYKVIEPDLWNKMVLRVSGANFGANNNKNKLMAFKNGIDLPNNHTWKSYTKFLLSTLPVSARENYTNIFKKYIRGWMKKGFGCTPEVIDKLNEGGYAIEIMGKNTRTKAELFNVRFKRIYDELGFSYSGDMFCWKQMGLCILKGDHFGQSLDYSQTKAQVKRQKELMEKYKCLK